MQGYESIADDGLPSRGSPNPQDVREEGDVRTLLRGSSSGGARGGQSQRRRNIVFLSVGVLTVLGVLLGLSDTRIKRQEQLAAQKDSDVAAELSSKHHHHHHHHHHAGVSVSVFESSMYTGARLSQGFPSPASLTVECAKPSDDDDSDSDDDDDVAAACPGRGWGTVVVDTEDKRQEIIGFGGAFTDATTINFYKLPKDVQDKIMDAYFGPNGIEYTVGRIPMGSCDFSVEQYSFDDVPGDYNLTHFDDGVERDAVQRIPMLLEALKRQEDLQLFVSPWSPPAWMKEPVNGNQSMIESAEPQGLLADPRVHAAWALFFSKFITAYKEQGVDMWGLTIQNESENQGPWEACVYTPSSQAKFIRDHLGPVMRRDHPDVKIIAFDHNRDHMVTWAKELMRDEETSQYLDGIGFHWYFASANRLLDGSLGWGAVNTTHDVLGDDKFVLSTECCNCPNVEHSLEGGWKRGEHTAHEMIADVNSWSAGWVDWNLLLDYDGGPNHVGNLCDSPVICNKNHSDVTFQPMFYFLGHMSKFAKPGARRLKSHVTGSYEKGGMGPSTAVIGYEATVYGCEGSVRQSWELSATGKISLADYYGAQEDWFQPMCLSKADSDATHSINLVSCDSDHAGTFIHDPASGQLVLQPNDSSPPNAADVEEEEQAGSGSGDSEQEGLGPELLTYSPSSSPSFISPPSSSSSSSSSPPSSYDEKKAETKAAAAKATSATAPSALCLDVLGGSLEDGAVLTLAPCVGVADDDKDKDDDDKDDDDKDDDDKDDGDEGSNQRWAFSEVEGGAGEGSIVSLLTGQCVTAGWPFFTGAAFEMSEESRDRYGKDYAVVLLNEAEEPVEFDVSFPSDGFTVRATIGARSIQTILA